jgi:hypothetical protein
MNDSARTRLSYVWYYHEILYLYIRNSAPEDRGEHRPLQGGPIGQDRRRGLPLQLTLSYLCTRPQTGVALQRREKGLSGGCSARGLEHQDGAIGCIC